ncbi:hypothetical protein MKX03_025963 [Papaver bracteatum]|nr:hypothetical protein MKX03_025963 [Papaver bracteatum]
MNRSLLDSSPFDTSFVNLVLNFARTSLFMYQYGDALGAEHSKSIEHVLSLIINPIHIDDPTHKEYSSIPVIDNIAIPLSQTGEIKLPDFSDFFKGGGPKGNGQEVAKQSRVAKKN